MKTQYQLDYPPTVNTYWRMVGHKVLISAKGREYRAAVADDVLQAGRVKFDGPVTFKAVMHPPDKRARDLDNTLKALLDSLTHAGVMQDDKQVRRIEIEWGDVVPGGLALIEVSDYEQRP